MIQANLNLMVKGVIYLNKSEFCKLLESGRKAYQKAEEKTQTIYNRIEENFRDVDLSEINTNAENADSVNDAISCYMQYGEYSPEQIWEELNNNIK